MTLDVIGQDGLSYAPVTDDVLEQLRGQLAGWNDDPPGFDWSWRTVGEYLDRLDADGIAINAAYLAPHGTIRMCAMGYDDRPPTADELAHMKRLLAEALEQGAVGLSTGLTYTPGMYADDDEIVALLEVVREHGGYYTPHHRNYGQRALEAYADCIEIARRSGVPLHLAHAHLGYRDQQGPGARAARADRRGAGRRDRGHARHVSVSRRQHVPARVPAELDARRRQRGDDRAAAGPGAARAAARRDRGRGLRRLPRDPDRLVGDRGRRTPDLRDCGGGGRPADRLRLRAARRAEPARLVHCPYRQRGERAHDDDALVAHRRQRRDHRRRPAAPARLGHVPALLRRLRARARDPRPGSRRCGR